MKKPQAIQISIPQPCSEDWQKMTPQEKGRYCDACQKCVVDFTGFSDRQLYDYFIQHANEKVCGRFHNTQLNRPINIPPQSHSKLYRIAVALGLAIAVVTAAEQRSFAKAPLVEYSFVDNYNTDDTTQDNIDSTYATIKGQVVDENGEPLINAAVELCQDWIVKIGVITDINGNYIIDLIPPGKYTLMTKGIDDRHNTEVIENIEIMAGQIITHKFIMRPQVKENTISGAISYQVPLIDPDNPGNGSRTIKSHQIDKLAH